MEETREEQIKRLKENKFIVFGGMSDSDKTFMRLLKCSGIDMVIESLGFSGWEKVSGADYIYNCCVYRISPDYTEKQEPEKYLSFDIDLEKFNYGVFEFNDEARGIKGQNHYRIDSYTINYHGTKYRFKHWEFDLGDVTKCRTDYPVIAITKDETFTTNFYIKTKQDNYKTISANRITFERCE